MTPGGQREKFIFATGFKIYGWDQATNFTTIFDLEDKMT